MSDMYDKVEVSFVCNKYALENVKKFLHLYETLCDLGCTRDFHIDGEWFTIDGDGPDQLSDIKVKEIMATTDIPFSIGDTIFVTFGQTKVIKETIRSITVKEDYFEVSGQTILNWRIPKHEDEIHNIYFDEDSAKAACIKWAKSAGRDITKFDIVVKDNTQGV
jgi:hypothetical protein